MGADSHVTENAEGQLVLSDAGEVVARSAQQGIDMTNMRRFAELSKNKKRLDANLEEVKKEMAKLEQAILKDFEENGIGNMNVDGMTIYTHTQVWASAKDKDIETACFVMKHQGLGQFVKESFNTQTVSAWVRERRAAVEEAEQAAFAALERGDQEAYDMHIQEMKVQDIPEAVKGVLNISEVPSIRARKS